MSSISQELEIVSGESLDNIEACAGYVSGWLTGGVPNTKPKSTEELLNNATESMYAMYDGHAIGHIATTEQNDAIALHFQAGNPRGSSAITTKQFAHHVIESVVVKPGLEGFGIGTILLQTALAKIAGLTTDAHDGSIASALACDASLPLFKGQGFAKYDPFWGGQKVDFSQVEPYSDMDLLMTYALGKNIVSKIMKGHHE